MKNEPRTYASLSSGLLARKGTAKPAMRPQGYTGFEDLGWNDMGQGPADDGPEDRIEHVPSSIAALTPSPRAVDSQVPVEAGQEEIEDDREAAQASPVAAPEAPPVVAQQRAILERFDGEEGSEVLEAPEARAPVQPHRIAPAQIVPLPRRSAVAAADRKAAFTLRLDPQRHVRLRLACAVLGRSAQQIVTAALDEALAEIPEIEALASRLSAAGAKRN